MADWHSGMRQDQEHQTALFGTSVPNKIAKKLLVLKTFITLLKQL
jgi:hypothetical protein